MRFRYSRGVTKTAMVLVSGACLGMLGLIKGDTAGAASFTNGGSSPVEGSINLVFALSTTLTLDVQTDAGATPGTALTGAADTVNWGNIAITPTGCSALTTTGACYSVTGATPAQVNLVGALQAHVMCSGFTTYGLYVYRATPLAAGSLPAGRVRVEHGAVGTTSSPGEVVVDWTLDATGTPVEEVAAATLDGSLNVPIIASGHACAGEEWVDYELAARVLSTDTSGGTTPVTHRLFAL